MILGLGIDVSRIERIERFLERYGERFTRRILTENELREIARYKISAEQIAGRVAVKEAASKALGTGWRQGVSLENVSRSRMSRVAKPILNSYGRAAQIMAQMGVKSTHVSITHDGGVAAAVVIFEG